MLRGTILVYLLLSVLPPPDHHSREIALATLPSRAVTTARAFDDAGLDVEAAMVLEDHLRDIRGPRGYNGTAVHALVALARVRERMGDFDTALATYREALVVSVRCNGDAYVSLVASIARVLGTMGRTDESDVRLRLVTHH